VIKGLEHVALSVSDLQRSLAFYTELIGLELVRVIDSTPEMGLGRVNALPGSAAKIAHLQAGPMMLELFEYTDPRGRAIPGDRNQADQGYIHAGFTSDDVRADHARLAEAGVRFLGEPVEYRPGVWIVYFYGPDGEVCELRQS